MLLATTLGQCRHGFYCIAPCRLPAVGEHICILVLIGPHFVTGRFALQPNSTHSNQTRLVLPSPFANERGNQS
jgi:hypothetical protein